MSLFSVVLFGTSSFAVPTARHLTANTSWTLIGVVTQPDARSGRGRQPSPPPLAAWARENEVPLYQPTSKNEIHALVQRVQPDLAITAAYGRIIPADAIAIPRFGFLNIHPSLLPRWRGASPIQAAIAAGDTETGVTIFRIDSGVDTGPIIAQERTPLLPDATHTTLEASLAELSVQLLTRVLPEFLAGRVTPQPQDDTNAKTCPLLTREDGKIDWHEPAQVIERKVRAYEGWPGTWSIFSPANLEGEIKRGWHGKRLKILAALIGDETSSEPSTILRTPHGRPAVACGDRRTLILTRVQPEGKPPMNGEEFLRGYRGEMRFT